MSENISEIAHNQPEFTVSEISQALKSTVESAFGYVRVRGEITGFKRAASGHLYFNLKDENAVLNGVCWRGVASRFSFEPEDGLEVICSGKISTYESRSNYQIIVDQMEPAGVGALLAQLEKRKQHLAKEGLFDEERKQSLPYLPRVVGVVTSPTGAVIRDILHRLADRFPVHVIVWPVLVQGDGAKEQITAAIEGFNTLSDKGNIPTPDVLIVARGGGSLEDLWAFNEEEVVRAAAASKIPLISAVGHETDTTLIDYASDKRAPTPTAAAEMAVPVREDLLGWLYDVQRRLFSGVTRQLDEQQSFLQALAGGLLSPRQLLDTATQRLDDWSERLGASLPGMLDRKGQELALASSHLKPQLILRQADMQQQKVDSLGQLLESYHYKKVLARGFALVRSEKGQLVSTVASVKSGMALDIEFQDGRTTAIAGKGTKSIISRKKTASEDDGGQETLF